MAEWKFLESLLKAFLVSLSIHAMYKQTIKRKKTLQLIKTINSLNMINNTIYLKLIYTCF